MNNLSRKRSYKAPQLTVVKFKAERGYLASDVINQMNLMKNDLEGGMENSRQMEYYTEQENWHSGGQFWN